MISNVKLQTKILVSFSILVITIIGVFGFFLNNYLFKNVEDRITDNMSQLSIKISQHVDSYFTEIDQVSKNIIVNETLTDTLSDIEKQDSVIDSYKSLIYTRGLEKTMSKTIAISTIPLPYVYVFSANGKYKFVYNPMNSNFELINNNRIFMDKLNSRDKVIYSHNKNTSIGNGVDSFSLIRAVFDLNGKMYGYVEVQQIYSELDRICDIGNTGNVFILDGKKNIIYPSEKININDQNFIVNAVLRGNSGILRDDFGNVFSYNESEYTGFTIYVKHPKESVFAPLYLVQKSTYAVIIILTVLSLLMIYFIARLLVNPIRALRDNVIKVTYKNMKLNLNDKSLNNEVTLLKNAFQDMLNRLKESVDREITLNKEEAKARFTALQAQIAPHFIHNVLYLISIFAQENKTTDVVRMCKELSNMLRYVVDSPFKSVKLEEEINYTCNYLSLQKQNYEDFLKYRIEMSDRVKQIDLPRLVIQPFVENAIHHGFKNCRPPWEIIIKCIANDEYWSITIEDNGTGMNEEKLKEVQAKISSLEMVEADYRDENAPGMCSMGIINTVMRLKLMYKDYLDFKIGTNLLGGTTICIKGKMDCNFCI